MRSRSANVVPVVVALLILVVATIVLCPLGHPGVRDSSLTRNDYARLEHADSSVGHEEVVRAPVIGDGGTTQEAAVAAIVAMDRETERSIPELGVRAVGKLQPPFIVTTDTDGRAALPPGSYEVESCDTSVEVLTKELVASEGIATILWCAYRHSLHLRVVDPQGLPVYRASVSLSSPSLGTNIRPLGCTDHNGLLLAEGVTSEPAARLQVVCAGYFPGQFALPFQGDDNQDRYVDLVLHRHTFDGGIELTDYQGRAHANARITAITADVSVSQLPPIVLGETDSNGRLSLPGDIGDYKLLRVEGPTVYDAEIRNLRISGGAFEKAVIPRKTRTLFRTTVARCKWQAISVSEAPAEAVNAVVLIHDILDAADSTEVVSALPEGASVNVNVWGDGRYGIRENVVAQGDSFEVFAQLTVAEARRTVILVGQVDQIASFSIYARGSWESIALEPSAQGSKQVRLPTESVSCRLTSFDGAQLAVWGKPGKSDTVLHITFPVRQRVRLHVVDPDGHSITNVRVTFHQAGRLPIPSDLAWRMAPYGSVPLVQVDACGEAEVLLFAGEHRVVLNQLEDGHLTGTWSPLTGNVVTIPTERPLEIVSPRTRLLKVHVEGSVPRRWNLFALPRGSFVTCFGRNVCVWQLGGTQTIEARDIDGTVFARGVPSAGTSCDSVTLYGL